MGNICVLELCSKTVFQNAPVEIHSAIVVKGGDTIHDSQWQDMGKFLGRDVT